MEMYGPLKPAGYKPRLTDELLKKKLSLFGGIEICGTRWCGKSWSALAFGKSITYCDEALEYYRAEPKALLSGEKPHVIDEWQDVPEVWNIARHDVDLNKRRGASYIFTGSSTPPHWEDLHSGAGRFSKIRMRTMSLVEQGISTKKVSLQGLFNHEFEPHQCHTDLEELARILCHGGWPELVGKSDEDASLHIEEYFNLLFHHSMKTFGCKPEVAIKVAQSLARCNGSAAKQTTIVKDVFSGSEEGSRATVSKYLEALRLNYFFDYLPAWDAPLRSHVRLRKQPKRYVDDPSLAASLLNLNAKRLIKDFQEFGILFENACVHDLWIYSSLLEDAGVSPLFYFQTPDGLEVDVIIELKDGRWAAIEIKLGPNKIEEAAQNLLRLKNHVAKNKAAKHPDPEFMAVVLGTCDIAHQREKDGIYVFPLLDLTV